MNLLTQILKMIGGLLIGAVIGLTIAAVVIVLFTDTTFSEFWSKLISIRLGEAFTAAAVGILSFIIALLVLIPLHELGHLVCGLLSGYKFVSFRIFNYTFIKVAGKLKVKKFAVAGTGGQCLLDPPYTPIETIGTGWYNAGGLLANLLIFLLMLPLLWMNLHPFLDEFVVIFLLTDFIIILMNGIPVRVGGIGNDGYNMLLLEKQKRSKEGLIRQLHSNALIQQGVRPKDMPDELFVLPEVIDYGNALEVAVALMVASRNLDKGDYLLAREEFEELYRHRDRIIPLYVKEIVCELSYLLLITGETEEARKLLDKEQMKYVDTYSKVMSSKKRLQSAIALYIDRDREKSLSIYNDLKLNQDSYLLQGEVKSDLSLMQEMLQLPYIQFADKKSESPSSKK